MFDLSELEIPVLAAPMAGGPSTPDLVAAVGLAGGTGFLAGGYKTPDALRKQFAEVRARRVDHFGVNLFVPGVVRDRAAEVSAYRAELEGEARRYGAAMPGTDPADRDLFEEKVELLESDPVAMVSFTFGLPEQGVLSRLRAVGSRVVATVTNLEEARIAERRGADVLAVQGSEAGGHRATYDVEAPDDGVSTIELLELVSANSALPLIAAGGCHDGAALARALRAGAAAVQLGTAFLRSPESGAAQPHKDALADPRFTETVVTRAFSGRNARGLRNRFIDEHDANAPSAYPEVNQLTKPLRAGAGARADQDGLALWAGTGFRSATADPAADVVGAMWQEARREVR